MLTRLEKINLRHHLNFLFDFIQRPTKIYSPLLSLSIIVLILFFCVLFEIYLISFHTSNDSKTPSHGDVDETGNKKLFNFIFSHFYDF